MNGALHGREIYFGDGTNREMELKFELQKSYILDVNFLKLTTFFHAETLFSTHHFFQLSIYIRRFRMNKTNESSVADKKGEIIIICPFILQSIKLETGRVSQKDSSPQLGSAKQSSQPYVSVSINTKPYQA